MCSLTILSARCLVSLSLFALLLVGCEAPSPFELAGEYVREYDGFGTETIELKADGTLVQHFEALRSGNKYKWEGKWHTEGSSGIVLEGVVEVYEKPDSKGERIRGIWNYNINTSHGEVSSIQWGEEGPKWEKKWRGSDQTDR